MRPMCAWAFIVVITVVLCSINIWFAAIWTVLVAVFLFVRQHYVKHASHLFFVITISVCILVVLSFSITTLVYSNAKTHPGRHTLTGTVESFTLRHEDQGASFLTLSDTSFNGDNLNARVRVFIRNFDPETSKGIIELGSRISFTSSLNTSRVNHLSINNRIMYTANINYDDINIDGKSNTPKHTITRYSNNFLKRYMSPQNASVIFAMLFGDRSTLDDDTSDNFRISGLTHILSVSGLHVGILIGMLIALLKLLRIRTKYQFPIVLTVLLFYLYLCDFRFSILRASIMFMILLFNRIYLRRHDLLSSICAAMIITLLIFPYALWAWSFQLSYACMFGIAFFYQPIQNLLKRKLKIPRFFINGMAIYFCVTISTLPLVIMYFNAIPVFGLVTNLFFLPILVLGFKMSVIALTTWLGGSLLYVVNKLVALVRIGTNAIARIPFAQIHVSNDGYWFLVYFLALILCSRFIFIRPLYKYPAATMLFGIYFISLFV